MLTNDYNAFISYRHLSPDQEIAKKLHSLIENYNIPSSLKKSSGISKMGRVFRDQEELPLSSNLGEDIRQALRNSKWLICICSPRYLKSKWCLEEVDYFISLGKRDKILAVLVEGEPKDSFPLSLRFEKIDGQTVEREPLAADVRAGSLKDSLKKLHNEKLRILAPMLKVNYDDLKQRDRIRKNKFRAAVATGIILLLSAFLMYVVIKNRQISDERNSALIAESKWLAQSANQALDNGDKNLSLLLSLEALPKDAENPDRPIVNEAVSALYNGLIYGANDQYSAIYDIKTAYQEYFGLQNHLVIKNGDDLTFYNKTDGTIEQDDNIKHLLKDDIFAGDYRQLADKEFEKLTEEELEDLGLNKYFHVHNIYRGKNELAVLKAYSTIYLSADSRGNFYLYDKYLLRHSYKVDLKQYRDGGFFNYYETVEENLLYLDSTKDGDYITALYKPYIVIWDYATEEINTVLFYPDFDKSFFIDFNLAPQDSILAIQTVSGNVFTYDIKNRKNICRMDNKSNPIDGFCFNADGTRILAYSTERKMIMLFNAGNGEMLQYFTVDFPLEKAQYFYKDGYGNAVRDDYIIASGENILRIYMAGNSSSLDVITPLKDTIAINKPSYSTLSDSGKIVISYVTNPSAKSYIYISDTFSGEVLNSYPVNTSSHTVKAIENNEVFLLETNFLQKDKDNEYAYVTVFDGDTGEIKDAFVFVPDFNYDGNPDEGAEKATKCFDVKYDKKTDTTLVLIEDVYDLENYPTALFVLDGQSHQLLWNLSGKYSTHNLDFEVEKDDVIGMRAQFINNGTEILIVYHCKHGGDRPYKGAVEIRDSRTGECKAEYFLEILNGLKLENENCYFVDEENGLLYIRSRIYTEKEAVIYDLYSGELKEKIPIEEYEEIYNNKLLKEKYWVFGNHRVRARDNIIYDISSGETILKFQKNVLIISASGNGEALEIVYADNESVLNTLIKSAKEMLKGRKLTEEERKAYFLE
jgi:WD40 repeat protein